MFHLHLAGCLSFLERRSTMSDFKSILAEEMDSFLAQYKQEVNDASYYRSRMLLIKFDEYLDSIRCTDKNITEKQIYEWLGGFDVKKSTICKIITTLRGLFRHLKGYGYRPFIPPYPKVRDDYIAYIFTDKELERIFSVVDGGAGISKAYPYREVELPIIIRILYGCGMRLGEVLSLKVENIDFNRGTFVLKETKSKEYRYVPMKPSLQTILKRYCVKMGLIGTKDRYLFPGKDLDTPISSKSLRTPFKRILRAAEVNLHVYDRYERGPCLYCFRHVFAHKSFEAGVAEGWAQEDQIPWLSVYLGHYDLTATEKYLKDGGEESIKYMEYFDDYNMNILPEVNFDE